MVSCTLLGGQCKGEDVKVLGKEDVEINQLLKCIKHGDGGAK